jgi:hypothetical protein
MGPRKSCQVEVTLHDRSVFAWQWPTDTLISKAELDLVKCIGTVLEGE